MSYYLVISFAVALIAVIYIWWVTRGLGTISDDTILLLNTTDNYLFAEWYKHHIKPSFDFNINEYEIAARLLHSLYDIEVDPNLIVIGNDIASQYHKLTRKYLPSDSIYDIRSAIGINTEIALIYDDRLRSILRRNNNLDSFNDIPPIIETKLEIVAKKYLSQILKYRWNKIIELGDDRVINNSGTFLYMTACDIPNVETALTPIGFRLNLLCGNLEFETLISRWKFILESHLLPC